MNPVPETAPSPERIARSKRFLEDYLADRRMRALPGDGDAALPPGASAVPPRPFSTNPLEPGQIRLLSQTDEPTYAVVLRRWERGSFLIAPFSRFGEPATDEELRTVFDGGLRMRVLQLWNVRSALSATLRRSWFAGFLPAEDLRDALRVWHRSIGDGDALPPALASRTGTPICRMDDPRLDYRREALRNFAAFDRADDFAVEAALAAEEARDRDRENRWSAACAEPPRPAFAPDAAFRRFLARLRRKVVRAMPLSPGRKDYVWLFGRLFLDPGTAAEVGGTAPSARTYTVRLPGSAEPGLELDAVHSPDGAIRIAVRGADGRPSRALDGFFLLSAPVAGFDDLLPFEDSLPFEDDGPFGPIEDGSFEVSMPAFPFRFWLVSPDAEPAGLVPKGGS